MDEEIKVDASNGYDHEINHSTPPLIIKTESLDVEIDIKPTEIATIKEEVNHDSVNEDSSKGDLLSPCKSVGSPPQSPITYPQPLKADSGNSKVAPMQRERIGSRVRCYVCNMTFLNQSIYTMHFNMSHRAPPPVVVEATIEPKPKRTKTTSKHLSVSTTKNLIERVQQNPCLYDTTNENFSNEELKTLTWNTIAAECNISDGTVAMAEWKNLLTRMISSLSINGQGPSNRVQQWWQYKRQMEFLLPYITDDDIHSLQRIQGTSEHNDSGYNMRQRIEVPPTVGKRKQRANIESSTSTASNSQPLDMFFLSMCATTKNLPAYVQLQVKKKIFNAVIEAEEIVAAMHNDQAKNRMFEVTTGTQDDQFQNNLSPFSVQSNIEEEWQED